MYYLKYRPQTVEELDLAKVRERLGDILAREEIPHAFLFSGPRGSGKTSAARIVAKAVNCSKAEGTQIEQINTDLTDKIPCNECGSCRAITQGRHLDIIEIDAASNRGIDKIRELRDKIGLSPGSARYKVYIIDEVHMLTKEAFNALLKTLEEPPEHAIFILATTEPQRLPETVRSRCVEVEFGKASEEEVVRSLERVVEGEGLKAGSEVLEYIASVSDGSFRDATKILEEAAAPATEEIGDGQAAKRKVEMEKVERVVGGGRGVVEEILELLVERDAAKLIKFVNERVEDGVDPSWLTRAALDDLHLRFLEEYGVKEKNRTNKTNKTNKLGKEDLIKLMRLLEGVAREERDAVVAQLPLEIAVIQWCKEQEAK